MKDDSAPARFSWLPPFLRPSVPATWRQERVFFLVGITALFAGYDTNVFGLALPRIQASLHIAENQIGPTISYFRLAVFAAVLICSAADLVGRRRLLLITVFGQALFTLASAFAATYPQFVWAQILTRVFAYTEEMLCFVVIAEEMAAAARGWAAGTIASLNFFGAGLASLMFVAIDVLPYGWRSLYVIGALPLFILAYLRRALPETERFLASAALEKTKSKWTETGLLLKEMVTQFPGRLLLILIASAAFGFGVFPGSALAPKYLQSVMHYSPLEMNLLFIPGGLASLALAITVGRLSDRIGRRAMAFAVVLTAGVGFALFYGKTAPVLLPPLWIMGFFGYVCGEALISSFAMEIMPTRYRATVAALRYLLEIVGGAIALVLEGRLYDRFHAHGPAIQLLTVAVPITLLALAFLPEPAGKTLEEMTR
jgi:MFS family permease